VLVWCDMCLCGVFGCVDEGAVCAGVDCCETALQCAHVCTASIGYVATTMPPRAKCPHQQPLVAGGKGCGCAVIMVAEVTNDIPIVRGVCCRLSTQAPAGG
jgi:hypothetical protein